jgi:serine O-acetyltransferase
MNLIKLYRVGHFFYRKKIPVLPKFIRFLIFFLYNSDVPSSVKIGENCLFGHGGIGVVLHPRTVIGDNCIIGQGITVGGKSKEVEVPIIGNHVYIAAGSRVLGPIKIGNYVIIAPNAVVTMDVENNTMVGGVPAKIIKENIQYEDYV